VSGDKSLHGFYEETDEKDWLPFAPFNQPANVNLQDPNVKFIDLNGDGMPTLSFRKKLFLLGMLHRKEGFDQLITKRNLLTRKKVPQSFLQIVRNPNLIYQTCLVMDSRILCAFEMAKFVIGQILVMENSVQK